MAFDVSGLSRYVDENSFELLSKAVLETNLAQNVTVRAGLQGNQVNIPILEDDFALSNPTAAIAGASTGCGWNANGTTTITKVEMMLAHPQVQRAYCVKTLRDTFMSKQLSAGAQNGLESLPFEQVAAEYFTKLVTNYNEKYLITGESLYEPQVSGLVSTTYKGYKGLITAGSGDHKYNTYDASDALSVDINAALLPWSPLASVAGTRVNALDAAMAMFQEAPGAIAFANDLVLVLGMTDYKALVGAMVKANLYHYQGSVDNLYVPGTNIRVVASSGILDAAAGTNIPANRNFRMLTTSSNLIMGTDLTSDFDEFKVWYSQDNDEVRSSMKWAVGAAIVDLDLVVSLNDTPAYQA